MRLEITPAQGKALAVALLLAVLWGLYALAVSPILSAHRSHDETIAELVDRLGHYRRIAGRADLITERLEEVERRRQPIDAYYLGDEKQALASAELQRYLKQTVERSGGQLVSSQAVPTRGGETFARVSVQVNLRGEIETLRTVLYELESGHPVVFVDELSVAAIPQRSIRGRALPEVGSLRIQFRATAYGKVGLDGWQD